VGVLRKPVVGGDRKIHVDYADSTHESWTYRDDGRVQTHTDARDLTTTYRYDADDRLAGSGGYFAINYEGSTTDVKITRDADGSVTSTVDGNGTTTNVYYPSTWLETTTVSAASTGADD
jgi:YD repeat-containing protein